MDQSRNIIARQLITLDEDAGSQKNFSTDLFFEIPINSSEALLSISLLDSNNRFTTLRSVSLILLSEGQTQIEGSKSETDWLTITQPQSGEVLSGGEVRVIGTVRPYVDEPIFIELVTDSGGQIGTRQLLVDQAGKTFSFDTLIPYQYINEIRDIRLIIRQSDPKFGETIILDSIPIFLTP